MLGSNKKIIVSATPTDKHTALVRVSDGTGGLPDDLESESSRQASQQSRRVRVLGFPSAELQLRTMTVASGLETMIAAEPASASPFSFVGLHIDPTAQLCHRELNLPIPGARRAAPARQTPPDRRCISVTAELALPPKWRTAYTAWFETCDEGIARVRRRDPDAPASADRGAIDQMSSPSAPFTEPFTFWALPFVS